MSTIALINPMANEYITNENMIANNRAQHLGIGYIASALIDKNHNVDIYDCNVINISLHELIKLVSSKPYDVVGISTYSHNVLSAFFISRRLRGVFKNAFIFLGGYLPTLAPDSLKRFFSYVDCFVVGEGELTTVRLMQNLEGDWWNTPGIVYSHNGVMHTTGKAKLIENLDMLSFPTRIDMSSKVSHIVSSRGCYNSCTFCSVNSFYNKSNGHKVRRRSPQNVVDEINVIINNSSTEIIEFVDENFYISKPEDIEWFEEFTELIVRNQIYTQFKCSFRADEIIKGHRLVQEFQKIGLKSIFIGTESFIPEHLKLYNKNVSVEDNTNVFKILDNIGLQYTIGFLMLNPITTIEDIISTVDIFLSIKFNNIHKYPIFPISFRTVVAYNGTPMQEYIRKRNIYSRDTIGYSFIDDRVKIYYKLIILWEKYCLKAISDCLKMTIVDDKAYTLAEKQYIYNVFLIDLHVAKDIAIALQENSDEQRAKSVLHVWQDKLSDLSNIFIANKSLHRS